MKVHLDASVLVRLSLGNEKLSRYMTAQAFGLPLYVCTSTYAISEALAAASRPAMPPKARLAMLTAVGNMLLTGCLDVWLDTPTAAAMQVLLGCCRDPRDLPILASAKAQGCDLVLTYDKDLLTSTGSVRCLLPEQAWAEFVQDPLVANTLREIQQRMAAGLGLPAAEAAATKEPHTEPVPPS